MKQRIKEMQAKFAKHTEDHAAGIDRNKKCCRRLDNQRGTNGTRRLRAR